METHFFTKKKTHFSSENKENWILARSQYILHKKSKRILNKDFMKRNWRLTNYYVLYKLVYKIVAKGTYYASFILDILCTHKLLIWISFVVKLHIESKYQQLLVIGYTSLARLTL